MTFEAFVRAANHGGFRPVIARAFRLDQMREAFQSFGEGGHHGKVVIDLDF